MLATEDVVERVEHDVRPGEIVIEIDGEGVSVYTDRVHEDSQSSGVMRHRTVRREVIHGNNAHYFSPAGRNLRSRFEPKRFGTHFDLDRACRDIDFIPGERIHLDKEHRIGRITDALFDPENITLFFRIQDAAKKLPFGGRLQPGMDGLGKEEATVNLRDEHAYWNWCFWMRRIVEEGCALTGPRACRPIQNVDFLPTMEECVRSCKVQIEYNDVDWPGIAEASINKRREATEPGYDQSKRGVLTPALFGMSEAKA